MTPARTVFIESVRPLPHIFEHTPTQLAVSTIQLRTQEMFVMRALKYRMLVRAASRDVGRIKSCLRP